MKRKLLTLMTLLLCAVTGAWADESWNVEDWGKDAVYNGLTYYSSKSASKPSLTSDSQTFSDGEAFEKCVAGGGASGFQYKSGDWNKLDRVFSFSVNAGDEIKVYFRGNTSGDVGLYVSYEATTTDRDTGTAIISETSTDKALAILEGDATETGTVYVWADKNFKVFGIRVQSGSTVKKPSISPDSQDFSATFDATISKGSDNEYVVYTTDGTTPTTDGSGNATNGTKFTSASETVAVAAGSNMTIKAIGYNSSHEASTPVSVTYTYKKVFSTTEFINFDDGNFTSPAGKTIQGITFGSKMSYVESKLSIDGKSFEHAIQFDGGSYNAERYYSFKVSGACKIYIYGTSNSSGSVRNINIKTGSKPTNGTDGTAVGNNLGGYADVSLYEYTGDEATTVYIMNRGSVNYNIYGIKIVFGNESSYTAKIGDTGYATLALPYATTIPSGITAYKATVGASSVALTEIDDDVIPANTGVVISGSAGSYTFSETTTAGTASSDLGSSAGNGIDVSSSSDTYYVLSKQGDAAVFAKVTNADYKCIPANKAYVQIAAGGGAPTLDFVFDENNTDENTTNIEAVEKTSENGEFYNLNGQRVAQPTKGLYIVNGKKIIIK